MPIIFKRLHTFIQIHDDLLMLLLLLFHGLDHNSQCRERFLTSSLSALQSWEEPHCDYFDALVRELREQLFRECVKELHGTLILFFIPRKFVSTRPVGPSSPSKLI